MDVLPRPRVFLSYSRQDRESADRIEAALQAAGCDVWLDRTEILTGDDFVRSISTQLPECDGFVQLLTPAAAASSWCQAELQNALALRLPVFVVRRDTTTALPDALARLLRDIQHVYWSDGDPPPLGAQLHAVRRRRRRLMVRNIARVALIGLALVGVVAAIVMYSETLRLERERAAVVADIRSTTREWSRPEVDLRLRVLERDRTLPQLLVGVAQDRTLSPTARFNAWQTWAATHDWLQPEARFFMPEIDWVDGRLRDVDWSNATYGLGTIKGLEARRVRMAGLVFGASPKAEVPGMTLLGTRIIDSDVWFLRLDGTQLIDVEFENTRFRGAQLDLSGAAGVRFVSRDHHPGFVTAQVGIVEDSFIAQRRVLPGPEVLDLATPEQEILFDGVVFERVRFEGQFKAEWFRNNHFTDCVFATTTLTAPALEAGGNTVTDAVFSGVAAD